MEIIDLKLLNFRNYEKLEISFSKHLNIIYGNNGMGKTNLVEAISVLALTRSFRTINDKFLIRKDNSILKIEGNIKDNYINNYKVILKSDGKKVKIDNKNILKISDYISKINVVIFSPDDLKIIKDTPSIRRKNLNIEISQVNTLYLKYLNIYNKILKQRNAYLKTLSINSNASMEYLEVITKKLIEYGLKIYKIRSEYCINVNNFISKFYYKITNINELKIEYKSDFNNMREQELLDIYKKNIKRDLFLGKTSFGIHHDDIDFILEDFNLKNFGSEGQQKNAIIALKLSEIEIIKKYKECVPILILDDLFSEIDHEKINNILNLLDKKMQIFITTTDIRNINENLIKDSKIFKINEGNLMEVKTNEK